MEPSKVYNFQMLLPLNISKTYFADIVPFSGGNKDAMLAINPPNLVPITPGLDEHYPQAQISSVNMG